MEREVANSSLNGRSEIAAGSRAARYAAGRTLRQTVSRESHADCPPESERDPVAILRETDAKRLPNLLPIRYQRMGQTPFTFLRGAAAVMARDLARLPQTGAPVQACGDCHLMNFGAFQTPEERMLFDINDFDETLPGVDFTVDLKRLVASIAVAARDAKLPDKKAKAFAKGAATAYREFIQGLAKMTPLEVWHSQIDIEQEVSRISDWKLREKLSSILMKSRKELAADDNFPHLATEKGGVPHIADRPPLIYHFDTDATRDQKIHAHTAFTTYQATLLPERRALVRRYALADIAIKVVGVGSVGTFCAVGLFLTADQEPLFLQVKQALPSVLEKIVAPPRSLDHQGCRVAEGQRAMQAASDIFLGWTEDKATDRQFYVRQLKNRRLGSISEVIEARGLEAYGNLCGRTLARAHARTGDPVLIAGYIGKSEILDEALASFAMTYAGVTDRDHAKLIASIDKSTGLPREYGADQTVAVPAS
jgi:uncharacterized protein (DUF2252 family)